MKKKSKFILLLPGLLLLLSLPSFAQERFSQQIEVANKAVEEGRFEEAIKIYSSILQEDPDNFAAQVRLARTYYFAANVNPDYFYKAIAEYNRVVEKWPDFSLPYLHLGQIAYLLGLRLEIEGREKHAQGLYQSALEWLDRYIKVEWKDETVEEEREIIRTKVLQAIVYNRIGEQHTASRVIARARQDYKKISPKDWGPSPLYDYFVRSSIDYITTKLYDQALIYLEGAWLIQPKPQIEKLFQSITKTKGLKISLKELPREEVEEEKVPPGEKLTEERLEELVQKVQTVSAKIETLPSLEEKLEVLKKQVMGTLELKESIDEVKREVGKIKIRLGSIPELEGEIKNIKSQLEENKRLNEEFARFQERVSLVPQLEEKIEVLHQQIGVIPELTTSFNTLEEKIEGLSQKIEHLTPLRENVTELEQKIQGLLKTGEQINSLVERIDDLDEKIKKIKSAADRVKILSIQLQETIKEVEELRGKVIWLEQELVKVQKGNKEE